MQSKTIFILFFIMTLLCSYACATTLVYDGLEHEYSGPDITLVLNDDIFEVPEGLMKPVIIDDRTLVPVREVFETLGGTVNWEGSEQRVDVKLFETEISLWINNTETIVNGQKVTLDVPAKIINDKTMVPVRFISEQAGLDVGWDGETHTVSIRYKTSNVVSAQIEKVNDVECLVVKSTLPISGYKYFSLPKDENNNFRLVLDVENTIFNFNTETKSLVDDFVSSIRFGNQGNDVNRIVLDLIDDDAEYIVVQSDDKKTLYYAFDDDASVIEEFSMGDKLTPDEILLLSEKNNSLSEENKIQISSGDANISGDFLSNESLTSGDLLSGDSFSSDQLSGDSLSGDLFSGDSTNETINSYSGDAKESGDKQASGLIIKVISGDEISNPGAYADEDTTKEVEYKTFIESIKYSTTTGRIKIKYNGSLNYSTEDLTDPYRLVLDFADAKLDSTGPTQINIKKALATSIRFSQYTESTVRVVIDLSTKCEFKIDERSNELQIELVESTYKNIKYKQNTSNAQITLLNTKITDLTTDIDKTFKKYTVTYKGDKSYFGDGILIPEDRFVDNIKVSDGKIVITTVDKMNFNIRTSLKNVVITIREKEDEVVIDEPEESKTDLQETPVKTTTKNKDSNNKIKIMIDVGHGGSDPGACNGEHQEKVYNLAIAMQLYKLLQQEDNLEVVIDRKDNDTYLNREDRVAYAQNASPDFIVSIHNNSIENKSYSGTMVLYYNNDTESNYGDITSKECAEIIVGKLTDALGTINRGVVNRQDLHILSKTPCPSILCEVCFISNDDEATRLKTKSFQESAAQAIYEGVLEIVKDLHK